MLNYCACAAAAIFWAHSAHTLASSADIFVIFSWADLANSCPFCPSSPSLAASLALEASNTSL